jgi:uncharacterized membrane protein
MEILMTENNNPYAAPDSDVTPPTTNPDTDSLALLPEVRKVSAGSPLDWIKEGWALMRPNIGIWILLTLVYFVIQVAFGFIPIAGDIASSLLGPVFIGGILMAAKHVDLGGSMRFDFLFEGFKKKFMPLLGLGGLTLAIFILFGILVGGAIAVSMGASGAFDPDAVPSSDMIFTPVNIVLMIIAFIVILLLGLMFAFSTHLVALNDVKVFDALKMSFKGAWKNILALIVYGLLAVVMTIIGAIPLGLGLLVVVPVLMIASYVSYKRIFLA